MSVLAGALATAGGLALSGGLGLIGQIYQANKNADSVKDTNKQNKDLAMHQMQYKVADYQNAGLNKILASNGGAGSYAPTMQSPQQDVDYQKAGATLGQALQLGMQYATTKADMARAQAEVQQKEAQTKSIAISNATELLKQQEIQSNIANKNAELTTKNLANDWYTKDMTSKLGLRNAQTIYQQNALNNLQQQLIGLKIANTVAEADRQNYGLNWAYKNETGKLGDIIKSIASPFQKLYMPQEWK